MTRGQPIIAIVCPGCGRKHHRDLSCSFCSTANDYCRRAREDYPSDRAEQWRLIGALVAGLTEGFTRRHNDHTREELDDAIDKAAAYMKAIRYVLPKKGDAIDS